MYVRTQQAGVWKAESQMNEMNQCTHNLYCFSACLSIAWICLAGQEFLCTIPQKEVYTVLSLPTFESASDLSNALEQFPY